MIANIQKKRIIEYLKEGKRFDGREPLETREIKIEENVSKNAEGSLSFLLGKTEIYVGVKMSVVEPYPDSPDEGTLSVNVELSPIADEEFELGPPKIEAIEMARVVDRGIRESGLIDFKKLCIKEGEKCWQINIDICAINNDGNLIDASSWASLIALFLTKLPKYDEEKGVIEKEKTNNPLPLNKELMVFNLTFYKIGDVFVIDPTKEEEEIADYRISFGIVDRDGEPIVSSIQKGREGEISIEELEEIFKAIKEKYKNLYSKIKDLI